MCISYFGEEYVWCTTLDAVFEKILFPSCMYYDIIEYYDIKTTPLEVFFYVYQTENVGLSLTVEDKLRLASRQLKINRLHYHGPNIEISSLDEPVTVNMILRLSQTIHPEDDESKKCKDYPTNKFESYDECDMTYVYNQFRRINLVPF